MKCLFCNSDNNIEIYYAGITCNNCNTVIYDDGSYRIFNEKYVIYYFFYTGDNSSIIYERGGGCDLRELLIYDGELNITPSTFEYFIENKLEKYMVFQ